jgi:hypothetical protein
MLARFDLIRSALVLVAAAIALVTAQLDAIDPTTHFQDIAFPILATPGVVSVGLALVPGSSAWSHTRREAAVIVAIIWAAAGLVSLPFTLAATGCACSGFYVIPDFLGMTARQMVPLAPLVGPFVLIVAASAAPDLIRRARSALTERG